LLFDEDRGCGGDVDAGQQAVDISAAQCVQVGGPAADAVTLWVRTPSGRPPLMTSSTPRYELVGGFECGRVRRQGPRVGGIHEVGQGRQTSR
jgi:hypothetical protein